MGLRQHARQLSHRLTRKKERATTNFRFNAAGAALMMLVGSGPAGAQSTEKLLRHLDNLEPMGWSIVDHLGPSEEGERILLRDE